MQSLITVLPTAPVTDSQCQCIGALQAVDQLWICKGAVGGHVTGGLCQQAANAGGGRCMGDCANDRGVCGGFEHWGDRSRVDLVSHADQTVEWLS